MPSGSPRYAKVLEALDLGGDMTAREIAEKTGAKLSVVKTHLANALEDGLVTFREAPELRAGGVGRFPYLYSRPVG